MKKHESGINKESCYIENLSLKKNHDIHCAIKQAPNKLQFSNNKLET